MNYVDNFRDLSKAFVGQYLCSARHKQNISTLQNIHMQESESLREFVKWFGQVVLQVESYSMDAVLWIFKRSICPGTPFFKSLAKKPPTTMDVLFWCANKYSMLEDDVCATTQQILVTEQPARNDVVRSFKPSSQQRPPNSDKVSKVSQIHHRLHPLPCHKKSFSQWSVSCSTLGGSNRSKRTQPRDIIARNVLIIKSMGILQSSVVVSITWWKSS